MRSMYSWSNVATHHIFFPPRLQVVAFQQHPDGLSPHTRNQLAPDYFFGQQAHRPASSTFWRRRADYGNNLLTLALVQSRRFPWTCGVEQRSSQPILTISLADLPHRLGRKTQVSSHRRSGLSQVHLPQSQSAQNSAYRLQTATQQLFQLLAIPRRKLDLKLVTSAHASSIRPLMPLHKCLVWLPIHAVMVLGYGNDFLHTNVVCELRRFMRKFSQLDDLSLMRIQRHMDLTSSSISSRQCLFTGIDLTSV